MAAVQGVGLASWALSSHAPAAAATTLWTGAEAASAASAASALVSRGVCGASAGVDRVVVEATGRLAVVAMHMVLAGAAASVAARRESPRVAALFDMLCWSCGYSVRRDGVSIALGKEEAASKVHVHVPCVKVSDMVH